MTELYSGRRCQTTFPDYMTLPKELQLAIVDKCNVSCLQNMLGASRELESLCIWSLRRRLASLISEGGFYISIFSPQHKEMQAELYGMNCVVEEPEKPLKKEEGAEKKAEGCEKTGAATFMFETAPDSQNYCSSLFRLGELDGIRDPLKSDNFSKAEGTEVKASNIHLIVSEDSRYIQLHFGLHLRSGDDMTKLFHTDTWLKLAEDEQVGVLSFCGGGFRIAYKLHRGSEVPPRSPYDYDVVYNYFIEFSGFEVNNLFLLHGIEKSHLQSHARLSA
ncbi:DEKNAAC104602 [Brettanomyces naardenensis]|uniref:DEKNAAC104602 n=1 Tax=Brettanomyces naardenensis TaxID=13370 RepID=A0A448YR15_BRENA|nr:DEKNAAC104602 [Brettanomyces naardenensis]